jgi:hypothetical protein
VLALPPMTWILLDRLDAEGEHEGLTFAVKQRILGGRDNVCPDGHGRLFPRVVLIM